LPQHRELRPAIRPARALTSLGSELLRAWCLNKLVARRLSAEPTCGLRESLHRLFVAELALHLAVEMRQGGFQNLCCRPAAHISSTGLTTVPRAFGRRYRRAGLEQAELGYTGSVMPPWAGAGRSLPPSAA
jgi:hypothetical protein